MPRIVPFAAGTAAVFDQSPAAGPAARRVRTTHYAMRARAILVGGACPQMGSVVSAPAPIFLDSPVPPASVGRRGEMPTVKEGAGREQFLRKVAAGSANNSWIAGLAAAKSLILEATCLTSLGVSSTSRRLFSTSRILRFSPCLYTSLSLKLLKKKEKAEKKGIEQGTNRHPRVRASFPRVGTAAYFLIHEFRPLPRVDSWKLVENILFIFNDLISDSSPSTNPRVALRVARSSRRAAGPGNEGNGAPTCQTAHPFSKVLVGVCS